MTIDEIDLGEIVSAVKSKKGKRVKKVLDLVPEEVEVKTVAEEVEVEPVAEEVEVEPVAEEVEVEAVEVEPVEEVALKVKKEPTEKQLAARERAKQKREEKKKALEAEKLAEEQREAEKERLRLEKKALNAEKRAAKRKADLEAEPVVATADIRPPKTPKVVKVRPDIRPSFQTPHEEPVEEKNYGVLYTHDYPRMSTFKRFL
jgi:hypothetical protein